MRLRIEKFHLSVAPPACRKPTEVIVTAVVAAVDVIFVEASELGLTQSEHVLEPVL